MLPPPLVIDRVSTEFRQHGIPRNFLTSEVISAQFRRNSAKFRGIPRNFAGIAPEITSVFRGMPKCHFRGHPTHDPADWTVCPPATTLEVPAIDPVVPTETRSDSGLLVGGGGLGWSSVLHLPLTCFWLSLQDRGGYPYRIGEAIPTG